jgi:hypothetical protein
MNQTDSPHSPNPVGIAWRSVDEIIMPVHLDDSGVIHVWLQANLEPLHLPVDLIHRIVKSIREILGRAVTKEMGVKHIHLIIFVPTNYDAKVGSWGFFRIERNEAGVDDTLHSHAVEFYLYPEGS